MTVLDTVRSARSPRRWLPRSTVNVLLGGGIAYPVMYVVTNDVVVARRYQGYSRVDQAVSELSATGAPTRRFLVALLPAFTGLTVAYGVGVWKAANGRRAPCAAPARCCLRPARPASRGCRSRCRLGRSSPLGREPAGTLGISR